MIMRAWRGMEPLRNSWPRLLFLTIILDLTVAHLFRDGNGRSLRAFANLMFLRRGLPPVLFTDETKDLYKDALGKADETGNRDALYELYYKEMLKAHAIFTGSLL